MSKELEALNDLLLLSKLSDGGKKGMSALKRADYNAHIIYRALERAKKVEEFISLCYVETTDTGHEVVFWRDENYEYAKQLLKMLKEELK